MYKITKLKIVIITPDLFGPINYCGKYFRIRVLSGPHILVFIVNMGICRPDKTSIPVYFMQCFILSNVLQICVKEISLFVISSKEVANLKYA